MNYEWVIALLIGAATIAAAVWFGRYRNMVRRDKYHSKQAARKPRWQKLNYRAITITKAKRIGFEYAPDGLHGPWLIVYELQTNLGTFWCRVLPITGFVESRLLQYKPNIYDGPIPDRIANLDPLETGI